MKLIEMFKELLIEMGNSRQKTEEKITDTGTQPLDHIIKILRYDDSTNYSKHIIDINNWLYSISVYIDKYNGKKLKSDQLLKWMLYDQIPNKSLVSRYEKYEKYGKFKKYNSLIKLNGFNKIEDLIFKMYPLIIKDLLDDNFTTITKYL